MALIATMTASNGVTVRIFDDCMAAPGSEEEARRIEAQYARALEAALAEKEALEAKCRALTDENAMQQREINRLRKQCRAYRFSRARAYEQVLEAQSVSAFDGPARRWALLVVALLGAVGMCAIAIGIVLCVG